jgi:hypothetical protein
MLKLIRVFTTFTIFLFLITLLTVYAFSPEMVGILYTTEGEVMYEMSRNMFFYSAIILFMIFQLIFYLFKVNVIRHRFQGKKGNKLGIWFRGMFLGVNIFFILMIIFAGLASNAVDYSFSSILYIALIGPVLLLVWILIFPLFYYSFLSK